VTLFKVKGTRILLVSNADGTQPLALALQTAGQEIPISPERFLSLLNPLPPFPIPQATSALSTGWPTQPKRTLSSTPAASASSTIAAWTTSSQST
jgi:hypothetical protein